jgi:hypothetical protein
MGNNWASNTGLRLLMDEAVFSGMARFSPLAMKKTSEKQFISSAVRFP